MMSISTKTEILQYWDAFTNQQDECVLVLKLLFEQNLTKFGGIFDYFIDFLFQKRTKIQFLGKISSIMLDIFEKGV